MKKLLFLLSLVCAVVQLQGSGKPVDAAVDMAFYQIHYAVDGLTDEMLQKLPKSIQGVAQKLLKEAFDKAEELAKKGAHAAGHKAKEGVSHFVHKVKAKLKDSSDEKLSEAQKIQISEEEVVAIKIHLLERMFDDVDALAEEPKSLDELKQYQNGLALLWDDQSLINYCAKHIDHKNVQDLQSNYDQKKQILDDFIVFEEERLKKEEEERALCFKNIQLLSKMCDEIDELCALDDATKEELLAQRKAFDALIQREDILTYLKSEENGSKELLQTLAVKKGLLNNAIKVIDEEEKRKEGERLKKESEEQACKEQEEQRQRVENLKKEYAEQLGIDVEKIPALSDEASLQDWRTAFEKNEVLKKKEEEERKEKERIEKEKKELEEQERLERERIEKEETQKKLQELKEKYVKELGVSVDQMSECETEEAVCAWGEEFKEKKAQEEEEKRLEEERLKKEEEEKLRLKLEEERLKEEKKLREEQERIEKEKKDKEEQLKKEEASEKLKLSDPSSKLKGNKQSKSSIALKTAGVGAALAFAYEGYRIYNQYQKVCKDAEKNETFKSKSYFCMTMQRELAAWKSFCKRIFGLKNTTTDEDVVAYC